MTLPGGLAGLTPAPAWRRLLARQTAFTDHSLFGFFDVSSLLTNKLLRFTLASVGRVVTVSHAGRANTLRRAHLDPARVRLSPALEGGPVRRGWLAG
jgi:hypothetical protein